MPDNRYMDLLNIDNEDQVLSEIKNLASELSDHQHLIRSCIFDLHAAVEIELRRIFFWHYSSLLPFTDDKDKNKVVKHSFEKMIQKLSFMDMWRILKPVMTPWYSSFEKIEAINSTRNQAAHTDIEKVQYDGRNPFDIPDSLCQMYFDVWAIKQEIPKFFEKMRSAYYYNRAYFKKYGDIGVPKEVREAVDGWYDSN
jgi:hypothetical protein